MDDLTLEEINQEYIRTIIDYLHGYCGKHEQFYKANKKLCNDCVRWLTDHGYKDKSIIHILSGIELYKEIKDAEYKMLYG